MQIEPITWEAWTPKEPKDFPCMVCRKEIATYRITVISYPNFIRVSTIKSVCESCLFKLQETL